MKKQLIIAIFILIALFGIGSIQAGETDVSFAIYLGNTVARSETPLSKMELSEVPFLTDADIIEYRWSKHEIKLSPKGVEKFKQLAKERVEGRAFVVVADGVRCYQGAFWKMSWSSSYPYPVILIDSLSNNILTIGRAYPAPASAKGEDPRNDKRIYDALKRKGKLKDTD